MNWKGLTTHTIDTVSCFSAIRGGRVTTTEGRPVNLHEAIPRFATRADLDEWEEVHGDVACKEFPGTVAQILEEHWETTDALSFEWDSLGPMTWLTSVSLLSCGTQGSLVLYIQDDSPALILARLRPKRSAAAYAAFFESLICRNGEAYGLGVFGSLPSRASLPSLLRREAATRVFGEWLDWAESEGQSSWGEFAQSIAIDLAIPDPMSKALLALKEAPNLIRPEVVEAWERGTHEKEQRQALMQLFVERFCR